MADEIERAREEDRSSRYSSVDDYSYSSTDELIRQSARRSVGRSSTFIALLLVLGFGWLLVKSWGGSQPQPPVQTTSATVSPQAQTTIKSPQALPSESPQPEIANVSTQPSAPVDGWQKSVSSDLGFTVDFPGTSSRAVRSMLADNGSARMDIVQYVDGDSALVAGVTELLGNGISGDRLAASLNGLQHAMAGNQILRSPHQIAVGDFDGWEAVGQQGTVVERARGVVVGNKFFLVSVLNRAGDQSALESDQANRFLNSFSRLAD